MRQQFTGFVRAVRGSRLLGNRTLIESEPDTRGAAEQWVAGMLASNVEAGMQIAEAGVRKYAAKTKTKTKARSLTPVETDTDVEREIAERQKAEAKSKPRRRARA